MTRTNTNLLSDSVTGEEKIITLALGLRSLDEDEVLAASGISRKPKNLLLPREHPETLLELPRLQESPAHHLLQKRSILRDYSGRVQSYVGFLNTSFINSRRIFVIWPHHESNLNVGK